MWERVRCAQRNEESCKHGKVISISILSNPDSKPRAISGKCQDSDLAGVITVSMKDESMDSYLAVVSGRRNV
jgi:hypothetical protein